MEALLLILAACAPDPTEGVVAPWEGVVVALQDDAALAFLDPEGGPLGTVDLSEEIDGERFPWMVHNVQVTPDGRTALATAMVPMDGPAVDAPDELLIVDLETRTLRRRCPLDYAAGAAHVVTDGETAWITAYDQDRVLVVDLAECEVSARWPLPAGTRPHGIRQAADGTAFFVAGLGDGSLHRLAAGSGDVTSWALPGLAVQVAVLADGSAVLVTLNDTRQVARLDLATEAVEIFDLPQGAMGPAQIYPTPDSATVWVADQGTTDGAIAGRELFRLDARTGEVTDRVMVSEAPHGVVVSADGGTVWTTTLGTGTVDRVDVASMSVISSVMVGGGPNGISCSGPGGASP